MSAETYLMSNKILVIVGALVNALFEATKAPNAEAATIDIS